MVVTGGKVVVSDSVVVELGVVDVGDGPVVMVGVGAVVSADGIVVEARVDNTGAAIFSGDTGRSLTRSSAALTICQARVVVSTSTSDQAAARLHRRIEPLSQCPALDRVKELSRNP